MFLLKKQKGVSLVEVLVSVTIMIIVSFLVVDTFYQARLSFNSSVVNLDFYKKSVESRAIFTNLVDNAYITGNATYSILKKRNNAIGSTPVINPFDYPLIYAQPVPLVASSNFPSDAQQGTDVLVVQTIDFPIVLEKAVSSSDQSITFDKVYAGSNQYMMLTDDTNQSLLETSSVHVNIDSGSTTFNLETPIGQSYPVGSTLYTGYTIKVIYIRNTGQVDNNGNPEFELFQRSYSNSTNETEQALLKGVSDLHISYKMSGQNQQWQAVTSQTNKRSWYREIRGIKIDYKLDGQDQEVVLSFNGISD
ncbi:MULTISPECIES: prepilin-type N-terminal cleavage/methylation domain-containing protein [unclassified Francisella]|uniref:prepilin-type N-terminal cleavage/methylation domain-containing protein n=1 Tax=unclassified Francisella TaxID=2610885 RepID=UPI002E3631AA|nr:MULTISPECIES: prepilin-type N-terminal cleavage/methylation domain-containing protein [unclassified Francisella]MED7819872.1 prepilin-type N-terminal cleavage/methylation domain-containing protein [Francisella sp. 19S2-4]MED7830710.1 prepilin-type N-terminal cleavage/methylation domain-containing protein [Francisella sp. 19S2-10]